MTDFPTPPMWLRLISGLAALGIFINLITMQLVNKANTGKIEKIDRIVGHLMIAIYACMGGILIYVIVFWKWK